MSRELINVGSEANDGTGETLRSAGQKINANFAEVYDGIATLDNSQAAQDNAIGQLATTTSTLNGALVSLAADVQAALGSKTNDADLALVAKSGAYADLSGKPALFSGAYGDLSGKPVVPFGFTYDQQTEPSSPSAGQTWRERTAGGLIIGDWTWRDDTALWLSITPFCRESNRFTNQSITNTGGISGALADEPIYIESARLLFRTSGLTATDTWFVRIIPTDRFNNAITPTINMVASTPTVGTDFDISVVQNLYNPTIAGVRLLGNKNNNPGNISAIGTVTYRRVRV
jgi:hypothetical protein